MDLATFLSEQKLSQSAFAELLGVTQGLVYQWLAGRRPVAAERCVAIERATKGAVTRQDLRPDDWRDIWPELDTSGGVQGAEVVEREVETGSTE